MLIVKPYGRSSTETDATTGLRRAIRPNTDPNRPHDITEFALSHPELVIAQWISAIDKIAAKPRGQDDPTADQRVLRETLGAAALSFLFENDLLADSDTRRDEFEKLWRSKIHPYGKKDHPKNTGMAKGHWYARFAGPSAIVDIDAAGIVKQIHAHLHEGEYRKATDLPTKRQGRIAARAGSIQANVLTPPDETLLGDPHWTDNDEATYAAASDVAKAIRETAMKVEAESTPRRARLAMRDIAPILYAQYGRLFPGPDGIGLPTARACSVAPGLFALHMAIKDTYRRTLDGKKRNFATVLPKDMDALYLLVAKKRDNRGLNALIRLGKVIHYQAGDSAEAEVTASILDHRPKNIAKSRYWTSEGQSEIKRNEAFVRVWRSVLALAARTASDWADPQGAIPEDVLGTNMIGRVAGASFDEAAYDAKLPALFGKDAALFTGEPDLKKAILKLTLTGLAGYRNSAFHFKGRDGLVKTLTEIPKNAPPSAVAAATSLLTNDFSDHRRQMRTVLRAAHVEYFLDRSRLVALDAAICDAQGTHPPIPRFKRILRRAETAWDRKPYRLNLPLPANSEDLKNPARLCQYTAIKMLYERAFPPWLAARPAAELNGFINRAIARTDKAAQDINDKNATARARSLPRLGPDETIDQFVDRISAATATEYRVQRGYDPDADNARKQSKYLDDFRCDVIAQAFEAYLNDASFAWLTGEWTNAPADPPLCDLESLPPQTGPDIEPHGWKAVLYLLLHLVPIEEVVKLRHQLRKWTILEGAPSISVTEVERVLDLYVDMHDAKFAGSLDLARSSALAALYESEDLFQQVFPDRADTDHDWPIPRRGLREMIRFGNSQPLMPFLRCHRVSQGDVERLAALDAPTDETGEDGPSAVARAQNRRIALHDEYAKNPRKFSSEKYEEYRSVLTTVVRHRRLASAVYLTDPVRLHRLTMQVLGRLVDYAGLWERDLYFATLALLNRQGDTPKDRFATAKARAFLANGQTVRALRSLTESTADTALTSVLQCYFGELFLSGKTGAAKTRNDLAHFNMLRDTKAPLNLTDWVNATRRLMRYDRKLKNAVSKSVAELLHREGIEITWKMCGKNHALNGAVVKSRQATHLAKRTKGKEKGDGPIRENLHSDTYIAMVAALFGGTATARRDILGGGTTHPVKSNSSSRGRRKTKRKRHKQRRRRRS